MFVPTKAFLTKGVGRHKEKLTSFEMALRDAHLANFNLVRVSSIFPPHCELVDREEGLSLMKPGQVVFAVIAESSTNEPSRLVAASIGVATPSFALAFAAGLLSFLSPCVLPLVPSYVGFLTGLTLEELEIRRGTALVHALWFVAGFSLVFVALGATASALGVWLVQSQVWIGRIGGVLVILFGLYLLGWLRPP